MGDFTDMFADWVRLISTVIVVILITIGLGIFIGYQKGYSDGITKCNNETIKKQLGI